ncbi:DUF115 domain-containing protein [Treponema primitia]|uniref:6-hydroxymethylpterin diphosphokinase MptE-like protein n=1 Tax=Treponema primitia TaxID=88058 RepID=UPI003980B87B
MLERLVSTGSGFPTVHVGDLTLHSRYNPPLEAEKYINSLNFREGVRFFILLEPGLGYTTQALRKKFPHTVILNIHVSDFFLRPEISSDSVADGVWSPGSGETLLHFLENHLPDTEAAAVAIVEWRPAQAAFGEVYLKIFAEIVEYIKRADANKRTMDNFGKRWFKNAFKNIRLLKKSLRYHPFFSPIVITGAGPSLEETIPILTEQKKYSSIFILAVSSSVPALLSAGLQPDLILTTDGGNWALLHLYETLRSKQKKAPAFAAAITAALPSQFAELPWLPISDGSLWQNLMLHSRGLPFAALPQRGTVTATALDLAFKLSQGPVYITGIDLGHRDIKTHARPYSFDRLLMGRESRFNPAYSQAFMRASSITASGSHGIYTQWFARQMAAYPDRLFSLGNNSSVFTERTTGILHPATGPVKETAATCNADVSRRIPREETVIPNEKSSTETVSAALLRALESGKTREILLQELGPLLFPGSSPVSAEAVREEIYTVCGVDHG